MAARPPILLPSEEVQPLLGRMFSRYRLDNNQPIHGQGVRHGVSLAAHSPTFLVSDIKGTIEVEANEKVG